MDLPALLLIFVHSVPGIVHLYPAFSPVWLYLFLLVFLSPGFAFLFFPFFFFWKTPQTKVLL